MTIGLSFNVMKQSFSRNPMPCGSADSLFESSTRFCSDFKAEICECCVNPDTNSLLRAG